MDDASSGTIVFDSVAGQARVDLSDLTDTNPRQTFDFGGVDIQVIIEHYPMKVSTLTLELIAALATNPGESLDYLEVISGGQPLTTDPLPFIAIPTTAGTGAEVTKNAVFASPEHRVKVSLQHNKMLPDVAIVDPKLTHSVPSALTAATGFDALTQVIEPFVSHLATPMTDGFCREWIRRAARELRRVFRDGTDAEAREDMAVASLFGGLALAKAKLGTVHGFARVLGRMYPAPHSAVCGRLLPLLPLSPMCGHSSIGMLIIQQSVDMMK